MTRPDLTMLELAKAADRLSQWAHAAVDRPEHTERVFEEVRALQAVFEGMVR
jgi:hypothetical protein